jgi:hypothetical protein
MKTPVIFTHPGESQEAGEGSNTNLKNTQNQSVNQYNSQSDKNQGTQNNAIQGNTKPAVRDQMGIKSGNSELSGLWQGPGGKMAFYPDGTMLYNNASYNYSFSGGQLTISGNEGTLSFSASISGNALSLSQNGNSGQYIRIATATAEKVDQQLVGKWCIVSNSYNNYSGGGSSSEECIILNADGTYIYSYSSERSSSNGATSGQNGDQGTWKTDGITISSTSRTTFKTTRYSISKENSQNGDPMIVIGGKKFVTAYNRPKW